jgi:hypothetical protein
MSVADTEHRMPPSQRNALVRRLYEEFPSAPAAAVADAVLHALGDRSSKPGNGYVEDAARAQLRQWVRRSELATARVRRHRRVTGPAPALRHSA